MPSANLRSARSREHLGQVAVDRLGVDAELVERRRDLVAQPLRLAEHGDLRDALADRARPPGLVHVVDGEEEVVHRADRVGGRVDGDLDRVLQVVPDQVADVAVERRREQHRLGAAGAVAQDPLDLRGEPVVGHPVGLVEHDDVDVGERDLVRLQQVDEAQRRGDDDLDALAQLVDLVRPAGPAVDGEDRAGRRGRRPGRAPRRPGRRARGSARARGRAGATATPRPGCAPASARRTRASCRSRCGPDRTRHGPPSPPGWPRSGS